MLIMKTCKLLGRKEYADTNILIYLDYLIFLSGDPCHGDMAHAIHLSLSSGPHVCTGCFLNH